MLRPTLDNSIVINYHLFHLNSPELYWSQSVNHERQINQHAITGIRCKLPVLRSEPANSIKRQGKMEAGSLIADAMNHVARDLCFFSLLTTCFCTQLSLHFEYLWGVVRCFSFIFREVIFVIISLGFFLL